MAFDTVMAELSTNSDITSENLWRMLGVEQQNLLQNAVQQLKKKTPSEDEIKQAIAALIKNAKLRALREEIDHKNELYLKTENPELKAELTALNEEMKKLKEIE